jgi:hypothetical protein
VPAVPAGLALALNRMPQRIEDNSGRKNGRYAVEKKQERIVRAINAASAPDSVGNKDCGNPEAAKHEQSGVLHIAS